MGCCCKCCSYKNLSCWQKLVFLNALLFVGAAAFAYSTATKPKDNLLCIVDALVGLVDSVPLSTGENAGQKVADAFPSDFLPNVRRAVDNLQWLMIVPGVLMFLFLFLVCLTSACGKKMRSCYCFSKVLVLLTWLILILNLVFFALLAVAGIASSVDRAERQWADATKTCTDSVADLNDQLDHARQELVTAQQLGGDVTAAKNDIQIAQAQVDFFDSMCGCAGNTLKDLKPLLGPGAAGIAACIFALFTLNALCCSMGCCCKAVPVTGPSDTKGKGTANEHDKISV